MTKNSDPAPETKDTKEAPVEEVGLAEAPPDQTGRVIVPEGATINLVPASDGKGGTVMVPANEPGHPDITTSPLT